MRFEGSDELTIIAHRGQDPTLVRAGPRLPLAGESVTARVVHTGRSARLNLHDERSGGVADIAHRSKVNMTVGAPVVVDGALWGAMTASWTGQDWRAPTPWSASPSSPNRSTEQSPTPTAAKLMASRARALTAGDDAPAGRTRPPRPSAAAPGPYDRHPEARVASTARGRAARGVAARRGAGSRRARQRGASRAGPRDPPVRAHERRSPWRRRQPRLAARPSDREGRHDVTATRLPPEVKGSVHFVAADVLDQRRQAAAVNLPLKAPTFRFDQIARRRSPR